MSEHAHLFSKVVQEDTVLLPNRNSQLEVLQSPERGQKFRSELVSPSVQEVQLSPRAPFSAGLGQVVEPGSESGRSSPSGRVSSSMSIQQMELGDLAGVREPR